MRVELCKEFIVSPNGIMYREYAINQTNIEFGEKIMQLLREKGKLTLDFEEKEVDIGYGVLYTTIVGIK